MSIGIAASAQTTGTSAAQATTTNATSVSMSTVSGRSSRQAYLEEVNAEARRIAFRHLGTSL